MLNEYEKVKIIASGITGVIVDIYTANGNTYYTVESEEKGAPGGFGEEDSWKLFECCESEIEKL